MSLVIRNARAVTLSGLPGPRRGTSMSELSILERANIWIEGDTIRRVEVVDVQRDSRHPSADASDVIDAQGRVVLPGFVDCHTHACWAGDRLDEWEQKQKGVSYLEILKSGGGIMSTVRAVRAASEQDLAEQLLDRLHVMLRHGTTSVEVKSGYGLDTSTELKMLRSIARAAAQWPGQISATACLGHALDPDVAREEFVQRTIEETLPAVSQKFPGLTIDAYCEEGAWSLAECRQLFARASDLGHPIRVHSDQFHDLGMTEEAIDKGFLSVDHLEATAPDMLRRLAASEVYGVMLPACGFHLDGRYGNGRAFVDAGGALALATNFNPGSAPCYSMPLVMSLAVRHLGLSAAEAIAACTVNAAGVLGMRDVGCVSAGKRADLVILHATDHRQLAFTFGGNPIQRVVCGGSIVSPNDDD